MAVVEDSNLYDNNDWTNFRNAFGLSKYQDGSLETMLSSESAGLGEVNGLY